jgi:hypothetical protein
VVLGDYSDILAYGPTRASIRTGSHSVHGRKQLQ